MPDEYGNELYPNDKVGNFIVDSNIGQGTFGTVYKVYSKSDSVRKNSADNSRKYYALKRIFITPDPDESENNLKSAELEAIFHKITERTSELFVGIHEVFLDKSRNNQFHLLIDLCEGENLMDRYVQKNLIPKAEDMMFICDQFFHALKHLKKVQIIHADIKPENIMFVNKNSHELKIIDFGNSTPDNTSEFNKDRDIFEDISDALHAKKSASYNLSKVICPKKSRIVCTAEYRPPEVLFEFEWSFPVDVYSFGCIIFELITGMSLLPPGLDDDYLYENFYQKNYNDKELIDECAADTYQEEGVGIIMKRRHLKCHELIAAKNKYDLDTFENIIFNEDKNTYKHSRKKRGGICKIVKWCMTSDEQDNQIVDTDWVDVSHLRSDEKHIDQVDFSLYLNKLKKLGYSGSGNFSLNVDRNDKYIETKIYHELMVLVQKMLILDPESRCSPEKLIDKLDEVATEIKEIKKINSEKQQKENQRKQAEERKQQRHVKMNEKLRELNRKADEDNEYRRYQYEREDSRKRKEISQKVSFNEHSIKKVASQFENLHEEPPRKREKSDSSRHSRDEKPRSISDRLGNSAKSSVFDTDRLGYNKKRSEPDSSKDRQDRHDRDRNDRDRRDSDRKDDKYGYVNFSREDSRSSTSEKTTRENREKRFATTSSSTITSTTTSTISYSTIVTRDNMYDLQESEKTTYRPTEEMLNQRDTSLALKLEKSKRATKFLAKDQGRKFKKGESLVGGFNLFANALGNTCKNDRPKRTQKNRGRDFDYGKEDQEMEPQQTSHKTKNLRSDQRTSKANKTRNARQKFEIPENLKNQPKNIINHIKEQSGGIIKITEIAWDPTKKKDKNNQPMYNCYMTFQVPKYISQKGILTLETNDDASSADRAKLRDDLLDKFLHKLVDHCDVNFV